MKLRNEYGKGAPPARQLRGRHCRLCMAAEETHMTGGRFDLRAESSLDERGRCRDQAACEARQPPLF